MIRAILKLIKRRGPARKPTSRGQGNTTKVLSCDAERNAEIIKSSFGKSADLVVRSLSTGPNSAIKVKIIFIDGLIDRKLVADTLIKRMGDRSPSFTGPKEAYEEFKNSLIALPQVKETIFVDVLTSSIATGMCAVLVHGIPSALIADSRGWPQRNIEEPNTESTVRGPKEGFVETLRTNTSLIRKKIQNPRLRVEERSIGRQTKTTVAVIYVSGLARGKVLDEIRSRLDRLKVDSIQESGHLEELIEDARLSLFPTMLRTERPDKVSGALLEGRVAILVDGSPFALIVPVSFPMFLTSPEDYFERYPIAFFLRFLRYLSFLISLTLPSLYVAVTTFHQEMLPTPLILSIAAQREGIPFPAAVEAFLMEFLFEILREAGIRLPRLVGPALSIIGALVIGEAAMRSGLVSPAMVMVVAATGIASFATPVFSLAIGVRILRFLFIPLAASLGFFGIVTGLFALSIHLTALRSFGVPFMEPFAPTILSDMKDTIIRAPWWSMKKRPSLLSRGNTVRSRLGQRREAPKQGHTTEDSRSKV